MIHLAITDDDMNYRGEGALSSAVEPLLKEIDRLREQIKSINKPDK